MPDKVCPYCVKPIQGAPEREHVFPRGWYPADAPPERLTVAGCQRCNRDYGRIEEQLIRVWGLCISTEHPASRGIGARVLRSLDRREARKFRDAYFRDAALKALHARVQFIPIDDSQPIPGLATPEPEWGRATSGLFVHGAPGFTIPKDQWTRFIIKLVRGVHCLHHDEALPVEYRIDAQMVDNSDLAQLTELCQRLRFRRGPSTPPAFSSLTAGVQEDRRAGAWVFALWEQLYFIARVRPPNQPA